MNEKGIEVVSVAVVLLSFRLEVLPTIAEILL